MRFARELDQYRLVETVSANGRTLVGRTVQNISVTLLSDGSFTVAFVSTGFQLPVPGAGIAFGSVGRLLLLFAPDNTLIDVVQDVGDVRATSPRFTRHPHKPRMRKPPICLLARGARCASTMVEDVLDRDGELGEVAPGVTLLDRQPALWRLSVWRGRPSSGIRSHGAA
jgi:hypothetical protein